MSATLFPGSVVTESGLYLISHSTGHRSDAKTALPEGLILPSCPTLGCSVSYSPVKAAMQVAHHDRQKSKTAPYLSHSSQ